MLEILFGIVVGLSLGLTGGGGSIFAVPLLIFGLQVPPLQATSISLAAVAATSLYGSLVAGFTRMIEWRAAIILGTAGILTAPLGVKLAHHVSQQFIVIGFATLMLIVAVLMSLRIWRQPGSSTVVRAGLIDDLEKDSGSICRLDENAVLRLTAPCSGVLFLAGCVTGVLSGFFGVGGGFLIVPALTFVTQLTIQRAVASSLFIISVVGISGVTSALWQGRQIPLSLTVLFVLGGIIGMFLGQRIARKISGVRLQKIFIAMIVIVALTSLLLSGKIPV